MSAWKVWERRVARDLDGERNLEETRSGGTEDVVGHGLPLAVQAKHGKRPRIYDAVQEAREAADGSDRIPVAAVMRSHGKGRASDRLAVLPWEAFLRLLDASELEAGEGDRPHVVCLCGSSRFVEAFAVAAWEIEKRGAIALSIHLLPDWYGAETGHQAEAEGVAEEIDELHLRKIDLADEVLIIDVDGYTGESTEREIAHALETDTPVRWLSELGGLRGLPEAAATIAGGGA